MLLGLFNVNVEAVRLVKLLRMPVKVPAAGVTLPMSIPPATSAIVAPAAKVRAEFAVVICPVTPMMLPANRAIAADCVA